MATWRAKCWLGSSNGFQYLEVQSNTVYGAREQLESVYGAQQVIDLHQVNNNNGRISSDMSDSAASAVLLENFGKLISALVTGLVKLLQYAVRKHRESNRTGR